MKTMYFKVYQDKNSIEGCNYYIETSLNIGLMLADLEKEYEEELYPVIEPIMMTEEEFDKLPEFDGY